jgi:stress-induced-phosphoprotein 1
MAEEAKAKGNAAFSAGDFSTAVRHFTEAIALAPTNHVLYSNRSAAYASLHQYSEALADAEKTVELKTDWSKGYSRLGAAHVGLGHHEDAVAAYKKGLEYDPNNEGLKSGLTDAQAVQSGPAAGKPLRRRVLRAGDVGQAHRRSEHQSLPSAARFRENDAGDPEKP